MNNILKSKQIFVSTITMMLILVISVCSITSVSIIHAEELSAVVQSTRSLDYSNDDPSSIDPMDCSQRVVNDNYANLVDGSLMVNTNDGMIKLYYYFKPESWWGKSEVKCKLDVAGNSIPCTYNLRISFFNESYSTIIGLDNNQRVGYAESTIIERHSGNNNYWQQRSGRGNINTIIVEGAVKLGTENIYMHFILKAV